MSNPVRKKRYWQTRELIVIGTFAALTKVASLLIAIAGGGMNPVSLVLKNIVATSLLIVLVYKVRKFGVLTLYALINSLVSLLFLGGNVMALPGMLIAGIVGDGFIMMTGGYKRAWALVLGVGLFDLLSRAISLGYSYLTVREEPRLLIMAAIIVAIGYTGCLLGLGSGLLFVKELRHAGIVRE
ncbi:MAG: MptD family putative ECF transporter S component [Proteobacteria bacterium]|nr:MptD family putative ECF transporter S component [Pseudomonadota bacterium]